MTRGMETQEGQFLELTGRFAAGQILLEGNRIALVALADLFDGGNGENTMATMTIRIPDSKHERLRLLAETQGVSLNKLVEEWASTALAQFDAETRFQARAARGSAKRGLALLDKLDAAFAPQEIGGKGRRRKR